MDSYDIKRHEGLALVAYKDNGQLSIGYGSKLRKGQARSISKRHAELLYRYDVARCEYEFDRIFGPKNPAKHAIVPMLYQLGMTNFLEFKAMIAAIKRQDWMTACVEAADSEWGRKYPSRLQVVISRMPLTVVPRSIP